MSNDEEILFPVGRLEDRLKQRNSKWSQILQGNWDGEGNRWIDYDQLFDELEALFADYLEMICISLESHGISPLNSIASPFLEFSYAILLTEKDIRFLLCQTEDRSYRYAVYHDLAKEPVNGGEWERVIEWYSKAFYWINDPIVVKLPIETPSQPTIRRNQLIQAAANLAVTNIETDIFQRQEFAANLCFVIMSFSGNPRLNDIYEKAIKPVVRRLGYQCQRVDEQQFNGKIRDQILDNINRARFVIADMTEARPNCYYELGIAHAKGKEVIHITSNTQDIHFDIKDFNFIIYSRIDELRSALRQRILGTIGPAS